MATASQTQLLYIAFLKRAADVPGIDYWTSGARFSQSLKQTAAGFATTPEYAKVVAGKTNAQAIDGFYRNLFARERSAIETYWDDQVKLGKLTLDEVGYWIAQGALVQPEGSRDKVVLEAKVAAAELFTAALRADAGASAKYAGAEAVAVAAEYLAAVVGPGSVPTPFQARQSVGFLGRTDALLGSINLSPDPSKPTIEQFQTEITTTVRVASKVFAFSSGGGSTLQVTEITNPAAIVLKERVALTGYTSQSVASYDTLLVVALSPADYSTTGGRGLVRLYRVEQDGNLRFLKDVPVGFLPDALAFNEDGSKIVIANEGEPTPNYTIDRPGSIGILSIDRTPGQVEYEYTDLGFADVALPQGFRLSGPLGTTKANDIEPENITIKGVYAWVTLQENNAVAMVNLKTSQIEKVFALGAVDFKDQSVDLSDKDGPGGTSIFAPKLGQLVEGLRQPDGIDAYQFKGKTYLVTANEGDGRDYGTYIDEERVGGDRVKSLKDDSSVGNPDRKTIFGGRSFSIFEAETGLLKWDSGNTLQSLAAAAGVYDDTRSDDKGVEPEGIVIFELLGNTYAIVALERTTKSMLAVFNVTDPSAVSFVTSRVINGSISPEGLDIIEAAQSPTGRKMLLVSNEITNTLDAFDLRLLVEAAPVAGAGTFLPTMLKDVAGGPQLKITSLLTNGEVAQGFSPGSVYAPTGIFDGLGAYDNKDGRTYTVLANSEIGSTAGVPYLVDGVALTGARITEFIIEKDVDNDSSNGFQSRVISAGIAYNAIIDVNGNRVTDAAQLKGGFSRFCSSSFEAANKFGAGRGFVDPIFLTGEETNEGLFYALDTKTDVIYGLAGLGRAGWETAIQVDTGSSKTVAVLLMDDNTAPILMWVATKSDSNGADFLQRNGLAKEQGNIYTWVPTGGSIGTSAGTAGVPDSADLRVLPLGTAAAGSWVLVGSGTQVAGWDQATLRNNANALGALQLSRLEDANINPFNGKQVVFATTGNSAFGGADTFGNLITLDLGNAFNSNGLIVPGNGTSLNVLYDGDRSYDATKITGAIDTDAEKAYAASFGATIIRNPDNLVWSEDGFIYSQEDRSVDKAFFAQQEASIFKVSSTAKDPVTGQAVIERWVQIDRSSVPTPYGQKDPGALGGPNPDPGNWESSGIIDVSIIYNKVAGSVFLADVQAHSLTDGNVFGNPYLVEGGQLNMILREPGLF